MCRLSAPASQRHGGCPQSSHEIGGRGEPVKFGPGRHDFSTSLNIVFQCHDFPSCKELILYFLLSQGSCLKPMCVLMEKDL